MPAASIDAWRFHQQGTELAVGAADATSLAAKPKYHHQTR